MLCNVIRVNKYKHFSEFISFSFSPSVTSVESSLFPITHVTHPDFSFDSHFSIWQLGPHSERTHTAEKCTRSVSHTHAGFYYLRDVFDSSCQRAGSFVLMELTDVCICIHHRETRRWEIDGCVRVCVFADGHLVLRCHAHTEVSQ